MEKLFCLFFYFSVYHLFTSIEIENICGDMFRCLKFHIHSFMLAFFLITDERVTYKCCLVHGFLNVLLKN